MSKTVHIPKVHDYKLIKHGCTHAEGSVEILKENIDAAIDAASAAGVMDDNSIMVCYRSKDQDGWNFGIAITNMNDLGEINLGLDNLKKLTVND